MTVYRLADMFRVQVRVTDGCRVSSLLISALRLAASWRTQVQPRAFAPSGKMPPTDGMGQRRRLRGSAPTHAVAAAAATPRLRA